MSADTLNTAATVTLYFNLVMAFICATRSAWLEWRRR